MNHNQRRRHALTWAVLAPTLIVMLALIWRFSPPATHPNANPNQSRATPQNINP